MKVYSEKELVRVGRALYFQNIEMLRDHPLYRHIDLPLSVFSIKDIKRLAKKYSDTPRSIGLADDFCRITISSDKF